MAGKGKRLAKRKTHSLRNAEGIAVECSSSAKLKVAKGAPLLVEPAGDPDKGKRIWREAAASEPIDNGFHVYKADPLDHAETDTRAYEHLKPFLLLFAQHLSKKPADLALWDPYYCKGGMVKRLATLGFHKVHNVNEDFYAVIKSGRLPEHDVIISSPPYSGDHMERCLRFCGNAKRVWTLLLPNWVQSRPYFKEMLGAKADHVFYISPLDRYTYWMPPDLVQGRSKPDWVGADGGTSPYDSSWYVYLPPHLPRKQIYDSLQKHQACKVQWVAAETLKAVRWKVKKFASRAHQGASASVPVHQPSRVDPMIAAAASTQQARHARTGKKRKKRRTVQMEPSTEVLQPLVGKRHKHAKWGNTISFE